MIWHYKYSKMLCSVFEVLLEERLLALAREDLRVYEISQGPEEKLHIFDRIHEQRKQKGHPQECKKEQIIPSLYFCHFFRLYDSGDRGQGLGPFLLRCHCATAWTCHISSCLRGSIKPPSDASHVICVSTTECRLTGLCRNRFKANRTIVRIHNR